MIRKYYEVSCDVYGKTIKHYNSYVPTNKELREICGVFVIRNGKRITICEACADDFKDNIVKIKRNEDIGV